MTGITPPSPAAVEASLADVRGRVMATVFEGAPERKRRHKRRSQAAFLGVAFVVSGALTGGTVAAFATEGSRAAVGHETDEKDLFKVLDLTGRADSDIAGATINFAGSGRNEVDLGSGPAGTADLAVAFGCLEPGYFTVGLGLVDEPVSLDCTPSDTTASAGVVLTGGPGDRTLVVDGPADAGYSVSVSWLSTPAAGWKVNQNGQTFGPGVDGNVPDLIASSGQDAAGNSVEGFVYSLDAFGPPQSTPEAVAEQKRLRLLEFPNGLDLPLYASDGVTVLGTFHYRVR